MTPREKEIFDLRIFSDSPVTLQEIGDRYGISRERVRQVEKNIIKKMRDFFFVVVVVVGRVHKVP